ncbi:hypothetical protein GCM10007857_25400 [Bradyrhizobium iriomotense]|uniref:Transposase n=1 Tax=Bradyrhizobium iriomotense TaxID=441950 RepID=A0ABQ6AUE5_9BRAD|nr:hypothetical protein GCM10007857_25400 [Bradyrhizobium iriomotense]
MPGVIDHRDIGIAHRVGEVSQGAPRLQRRQVVTGIDHVKTSILQHLRDQRAVVDGVRKWWRVLIRGIGDYKRDALSGKGGLGDQN